MEGRTNHDFINGGLERAHTLTWMVFFLQLPLVVSMWFEFTTPLVNGTHPLFRWAWLKSLTSVRRWQRWLFCTDLTQLLDQCWNGQVCPQIDPTTMLHYDYLAVVFTFCLFAHRSAILWVATLIVGLSFRFLLYTFMHFTCTEKRYSRAKDLLNILSSDS